MSKNISLRVKNGKIIGAQRVGEREESSTACKEGGGLSETTDSRLVALGIIHRAQSLPSLPTVVSGLASLLSDDNAGAADFERLIRPDPALTANLLRLANSPYFGVRREIASVRQAIALLGGRRVFDLAAASWFGQSLPKRLPGYDITAKAYWLHCIAVGVLAEQLAAEMKIALPDLTFTAGLLHDIGKLVIASSSVENLEGILDDAAADEEKSSIEIEKESIGTDHAETGRLLIDDWNLPYAIIEAVGAHHEPDAVSDERYQTLVDLVHLADYMAHALEFGADAASTPRSADAGAMERLFLSFEELEATASESLVCSIWEMGNLVGGSL